MKLSTNDNDDYYNTKFSKNQQKIKRNLKFNILAKTFVYFRIIFLNYWNSLNSYPWERA